MSDPAPLEPTPDGAAVSTDPGESGDPALRPPAEGERTFRSPDSDPAPPPATTDALTGPAGDPVEGKP